jgi:hypothetical protein
MEDLKYYPGEPKEYTLREITERVNAVENQAILIDPVSGSINPAGAGSVRILVGRFAAFTNGGPVG